MTAVMEAIDARAEAAARDAMVSLRWPNGVRCPRCQRCEVSPRPRRCGWRCRPCRSDFTVMTGTRLHAAKMPLAVWAQAAVHDDFSCGLSDKSVRRLRRVVESTGLPPGRQRLAALLAETPRAAGPGPLAALSGGQRKILAMLRTRAEGATAALVAAETGLSLSHVRRCLKTLHARGFVEVRAMSVMWGYRPQRLRLWRLDMSERTIAALPQIGWSPPAAEPPAAGVPGEFWWLFWSGQCASQLRIPQDAVHIADTLIGGPDPSARAWALEALPLRALEQLRTMTGYSTGEMARWLDHTIRRRAQDQDV